MNLLVQDKSTLNNSIFNISFIKKNSKSFTEPFFTQEKKEKFMKTWNSSKDPMWLLDSKGMIVSINKAFCDLFELKDSDVTGYHYSNCYKAIEKEEIKSSTSGGNSFFEQRITTLNGKKLFLQGINTIISLNLPFDRAAEEPLIFTVFRDVTLRENISNAQKNLCDIINPLTDAIIILDVNRIIQCWNKGAELIFGYTQNEVLGKPVSFLFPEEELEKRGIFNRLKNEDRIWNYEVSLKLQNDGYVDLLLDVLSLKNDSNEYTGAAIVIRNLTDEKAAEITLKVSEETYRTLIETSPDAILMTNTSGEIAMSNKQFFDLVRTENIEHIHGKNISDFIVRMDKRRFKNDLEDILLSGIKKDLQYKLKTKTGSTVPIEMNSSLILDIIGKPHAIIFTIRDVSESRKVLKALKKSEVLFRSAWENSNDGMRLTDGNGKIVEVNKAYCTFIGLKRDELIGRYFYEVYLDGQISFADLLKQYKKNFYESSFNKYSSSRYRYTNGQYIEFNESHTILEAEKNSRLLLSIFHNVTEMRRAEEELKTSEKFAALGKQAAILSHDIKTPLASIKMNIDMLYKSLTIPESNEKSFRIIQKEITRLVKLLKNVLQYSKEVEPVFEYFELSTLFENIREFMKPLLDEANAQLINKVKNIYISGDYKNLQTVFMQLIENSIEAMMKKGGVIEIYSEDNENYSSVFIKDNGCGILNKERIFDPFFTTKNTGTGLGLTIASNILKKHNAEIKLLSSKPGETIFEILFFKREAE